MDKIAKINSYYEKNFKELEKLHDALSKAAKSNINADNYKILGWESRQAQYARFAAFAKNVDLNGKAVLDVGCGLGDLFHFLTSGLGLSVNYVGIDISERMIETAKSQLEILRENGLSLPAENKSTVRFLASDVFAGDFVNALDFSSVKESGGGFDWIYASGIFNLNLGNNFEFLRKAFARFMELGKNGFVCSMLNERSTDKESPYFYYDPEDTCEFAKAVGAKNVRIIDDYLENDFTIFVEK
ncbi:MAG: class I SAM-dependent methyltransferase [Treponema sp.]